MTDEQLSVAMYHAAQREMAAFRMAEMVDGAAAANCKRGGRNSKTGLSWHHYQACADQGMSAAETARHLGVSEDASRYMSRQYGVKFRDGRKRK